MKKIVSAIAALLVISNAFAQQKQTRKSTFSIGADVAYPLTKIRYARNKGVDFGGLLQQEFLLHKTGITLNLGYSHPNDYYFIEDQLWLMAGVCYYFTQNLFAAAQLGPGLIRGNDFAGASFVFSPGIGIKFKPIDVSLHYRGTVVSDELFSIAGVRAAIAF